MPDIGIRKWIKDLSFVRVDGLRYADGSIIASKPGNTFGFNVDSKILAVATPEGSVWVFALVGNADAAFNELLFQLFSLAKKNGIEIPSVDKLSPYDLLGRATNPFWEPAYSK